MSITERYLDRFTKRKLEATKTNHTSQDQKQFKISRDDFMLLELNDHFMRKFEELEKRMDFFDDKIQRFNEFFQTFQAFTEDHQQEENDKRDKELGEMSQSIREASRKNGNFEENTHKNQKKLKSDPIQFEKGKEESKKIKTKEKSRETEGDRAKEDKEDNEKEKEMSFNVELEQIRRKTEKNTKKMKEMKKGQQEFERALKEILEEVNLKINTCLNGLEASASLKDLVMLKKSLKKRQDEVEKRQDGTDCGEEGHLKKANLPTGSLAKKGKGENRLLKTLEKRVDKNEEDLKEILSFMDTNIISEISELKQFLTINGKGGFPQLKNTECFESKKEMKENPKKQIMNQDALKAIKRKDKVVEGLQKKERSRSSIVEETGIDKGALGKCDDEGAGFGAPRKPKRTSEDSKSKKKKTSKKKIRGGGAKHEEEKVKKSKRKQRREEVLEKSEAKKQKKPKISVKRRNRNPNVPSEASLLLFGKEKNRKTRIRKKKRK